MKVSRSYRRRLLRKEFKKEFGQNERLKRIVTQSPLDKPAPQIKYRR